MRAVRGRRYANALKRFFEAAECRTQSELAKFLGIWQSSISDSKKRNTIPAEWLLTLWRKKGINPDWVIHGVGSRFLRVADEAANLPVVYITERRPPEECTAQELVNELVRRALDIR